MGWLNKLTLWPRLFCFHNEGSINFKIKVWGASCFRLFVVAREEWKANLTKHSDGLQPHHLALGHWMRWFSDKTMVAMQSWEDSVSKVIEGMIHMWRLKDNLATSVGNCYRGCDQWSPAAGKLVFGQLDWIEWRGVRTYDFVNSQVWGQTCRGGGDFWLWGVVWVTATVLRRRQWQLKEVWAAGMWLMSLALTTVLWGCAQWVYHQYMETRFFFW